MEIKAETFSQNLAKAAHYMMREKLHSLHALRVIAPIHFIITTTTTFVRHLHCHLRRLQRLNKFFCFILKHDIWCVLLPKKLLLELYALAIKPKLNL